MKRNYFNRLRLKMQLQFHVNGASEWIRKAADSGHHFPHRRINSKRHMRPLTRPSWQHLAGSMCSRRTLFSRQSRSWIWWILKCVSDVELEIRNERVDSWWRPNENLFTRNVLAVETWKFGWMCNRWCRLNVQKEKLK